MNCDKCQVSMEERKATQQKPYHYDLSGLDNIYLVGITVRTCSQCTVEIPVIPKIAELHKVIAHTLIQKSSSLNGKEIRFLRKQGGFSAQKFAALLGVSAEHLSRVENGHTAHLSTSADRLARAIATIAKNGETARDILLQMADRLAKQKGKPKVLRHWVKLEQNHWKIAA